MKKLISFISVLILAFTFIFSSSLNLFANEEPSYLESFKENYRATSYYEYVPKDLIGFNALDEDEVLDVFVGIKVTKRILDENFVLDIDKVTLDDLVVNENVSVYEPGISTNAIIPNNPIGGGGGSGFDSYRTLPTGYQNAAVTKRATVLSGQYAGMTTYIVNLYLSNSSLMYYIEECLIGTSISNAALSLLAEFVVTTYIGTISGIAGAAVTIALGVANIYNQIVNQSFYNQLVTIRRNGQKAHVQITESSKSVTTWTSSTIGYENSTRNGLKIESEIVAYKNF